MTLTEILIKHMEELDKSIDISNTPSTRILLSYYRSIGVTGDTSFSSWMHGVAMGHFPAYTSVHRSIRKARELHPKWKKRREQKEKEIKDVRQKVGYGRFN